MPAPSTTLPVSSAQLWFGLLAAPVAWALAELLGYVLVARGCTYSGAPTFGWFVGLTIVCLLLAIAGLLVARASWRRLTAAAAQGGEAAESARVGRARFLARSGMLASVLFLLGVALMGVLPPLLRSCSEVH